MFSIFLKYLYLKSHDTMNTPHSNNGVIEADVNNVPSCDYVTQTLDTWKKAPRA